MDETSNPTRGLTADERGSAVEALLSAYETRDPIDPLIGTYPDLTLDDAYAIQLAQIERRTSRGATVQGHKVGLTSAAMQRALGVDQPDYGNLLSGMFHSGSDAIDVSRFLQPRVEPELAFVMDEDLVGPDITVAHAVRAVGAVLPALEIIDSRIRDWDIGLYDTIADNASSGGVVLGPRAVRSGSRDLRLVGCNLFTNGELAYTGAAGAVLGDPILALVWLANTLGERGMALEAGHVVLPGSCTSAVPVEAGDTVTAVFADFGSVSAHFAEGQG